MRQQDSSETIDCEEDTLSIGIIGAGRMGSYYYKAITNYGARVAAVHDVNLEAARSLAQKLVALHYQQISYQSFLIWKWNGVVVTTPPPIRLKPIQMACERGIVTLVLIDAAIKSRNTGRFVQTEGK